MSRSGSNFWDIVGPLAKVLLNAFLHAALACVQIAIVVLTGIETTLKRILNVQ